MRVPPGQDQWKYPPRVRQKAGHMEYTYTQLLTYLLFYGFLGWGIEVIIAAVKDRRFSNRGFFDLPVCLQYGIMVDILIIVLPTFGENIFLQYLTTLIVVSVVDFLSGDLARRIWRRKLWHYEKDTVFGGELKGSVLAMCKAAVVILIVLLLHPFVFTVVSLIPALVQKVINGVILAILALDLLTVLYAVHKSKTQEELEEAQRVQQNEQTAVQGRLGAKIYHAVWKRLNRAYPDMEEKSDPEEGGYVFARGVCVDKLIWVFIICAFLGDLIETLFCRVTGGVWMSRSSVIYGAFSIVWGFGAVLLTVVLQRLAGKDDRHVFLAGAVLGGVYEYMCSVFTEVFFGTTFWDYSWMPFNIGGRTNLLYCIFWGLLSVVWVKICYPVISGWIEKLPALYAKVVTWAVIVLMVCDAGLSAAVMVRYVERKAGNPADTVIETFLDEHYSDALVEKVWPNMKIQ